MIKLENNFLPLISFNNKDNIKIQRISSGFLLIKNNNIFLLGALHTFIENINSDNEKFKTKYIGIELFTDIKNEKVVIFPFEQKQINYFSSFNLITKNEHLNDLFLVKVPKKYIYKLRNTIVKNYIDKSQSIEHITIFNEIKEVNYRDKYYLAGNIKPSLNYDKKTINQFSSSADYLKISKIKKVLNMKFVNYIENNELIFNLNTNCKNVDEYQGCSGAPIVNQDNELVSIAIRVDCKNNQIIGINLKRLEVAIDIITK